MNSAKGRARKKGLPYDLSGRAKDLQRRIDAGYCELSGVPFDLDSGRTHRSPSLDRINPSRGYVYDNIRVVCHGINCALGDWGEEALFEIVESWLAKRGMP